MPNTHLQLKQIGEALRVTATGDVTTKSGTLLGWFCTTASSTPTLVLRNGGSGGTQITGTYIPTTGEVVTFECPIVGGLHATISGTVDITFFVDQGVR